MPSIWSVPSLCNYLTSFLVPSYTQGLVVSSKPPPLLLLQVSDSFPFKWINKKWKEGFYVTSMATSHTRWAVVMSRNAGFVDQCVELDFQYPSEGIHRRWDAGFRITSCAATPDQVGAFGNSVHVLAAGSFTLLAYIAFHSQLNIYPWGRRLDRTLWS